MKKIGICHRLLGKGWLMGCWSGVEQEKQGSITSIRYHTENQRGASML